MQNVWRIINRLLKAKSRLKQLYTSARTVLQKITNARDENCYGQRRIIDPSYKAIFTDDLKLWIVFNYLRGVLIKSPCKHKLTYVHTPNFH